MILPLSQGLKMFCSAGKLCQLSVAWYKNNSSVFNTLSDQNTAQLCIQTSWVTTLPPATWKTSSEVEMVWYCKDVIKYRHVWCGVIITVYLHSVVLCSLTHPLCLSSACYGIVQVPTGPWFCRKCESQERAARVVSRTIHLSIHHLWVNSWNNRTV